MAHGIHAVTHAHPAWSSADADVVIHTTPYSMAHGIHAVTQAHPAWSSAAARGR